MVFLILSHNPFMCHYIFDCLIFHENDEKREGEREYEQPFLHFMNEHLNQKLHKYFTKLKVALSKIFSLSSVLLEHLKWRKRGKCLEKVLLFIYFFKFPKGLT